MPRNSYLSLHIMHSRGFRFPKEAIVNATTYEVGKDTALIRMTGLPG
jgi:hypothetical protein